MKKFDAIVVGSGPNGLVAAVTLAKAGHSVKIIEAQVEPGGGARTLPLTLPGFAHDVCSAIHPLAAASPVFREWGLEADGLEFIHPPVPLVHPLNDGRAAVLHRSIEETAAGLGADEGRYLALMKPFVDGFEALKAVLFNPITKPPLSSPVLFTRFGVHAMRDAVDFALDTFDTEEGRALFMGCAAHSIAPLTEPFTASFGLILAMLGHAVGWPMIRGGSGRLVEVLLRRFRSLGGELEVGRPLMTLPSADEAKLVIFDTHAELMARICGDHFPATYRASLAHFRRGPGVFKLDYALSAPMPWSSAAARRTATLHLGGTLQELQESEAGLLRGGSALKPFVLVAQHTPFDPSRAPEGKHTLWAYSHIPNGSTEDMTDRIEAQFDRFAPGWRALVLHRSVKNVAAMEASNASYLGGDISAGALLGTQLLFRPTIRPPYSTPNPRVLICSGSAPPGPGVHGMVGHWAAQVALSRLRG